MDCLSSPEIDAAAFFIHSTMNVTMTTAASDVTPAIASAVSPVRVEVP
ncbi:hypothetical protein WIMU106979_17000 [Williamsia muralis]